MSEIITGKAILERVQQVCADRGDIYLAVAYWGRGAFERLGLPQDLSRVHVVLNVEQGGTNPEALEQLIKALPERVHVHETLHAKIFASGAGAVVGSANASDNGLWPGERQGLAEAAVWMQGDLAREALEMARRFHEAGEIATQTHVERCCQTFGRRTVAAVQDGPQPSTEDTALDSFLGCHTIFRPLPFIVTNAETDRQAVGKSFQQQKQKHPDLFPESYILHDWDCFELDLSKTHREEPCINLHVYGVKKRRAVLSLVWPLPVAKPPYHFVRRINWSKCPGFVDPWPGNRLDLGECTALIEVADQLVAENRHCVFGRDIYRKLGV